MVISSMVGTVTSTSSQAINLLNYALSFDSFTGSDYVIFNDTEYSFYIVWGDLVHENGQVIGSGEVEYIHYYRTSSSGYSSNYLYEKGEDADFVLYLDGISLPTSSLKEVGFVSQTVLQHELNVNICLLLILIAALLFAIMIKSFRGFKS